MNPGQEKFLNYILERAKEGQQDEVKAFMSSNFEKQQAGTFGMKEIEETRDFLKTRIRVEHIAEVEGVMQQFSGNFQKEC